MKDLTEWGAQRKRSKSDIDQNRWSMTDTGHENRGFKGSTVFFYLCFLLVGSYEPMSINELLDGRGAGQSSSALRSPRAAFCFFSPSATNIVEVIATSAGTA